MLFIVVEAINFIDEIDPDSLEGPEITALEEVVLDTRQRLAKLAQIRLFWYIINYKRICLSQSPL